MTSTYRTGILIALLITFTATTAAVVDGPEPGEGEMAIMGHTGSSGGTGVSRSTWLDEHVTDIELEFSFSGDDSADMPDACQQEISAAMAKAERQGMCTAQAAALRCPHDDETVYTAPNGCVISSLEEAGWEQASLNHSDDEKRVSVVNLTGEMVFRTAGYEVHTSSSTEDGTAVFVINVSSPGANTSSAQVITTESIDMSTEVEGSLDSAEATVYIDGEEAYSLKETQESDQVREQPPHPPARPPAKGLEHRVTVLEQRVAALEQQVNLLTGILQEVAPERADELDEIEPPSTPVNDSRPSMPGENISGSEQEESSRTAGPPERPGQGPDRPSRPGGIFDAIGGFFR